LFDAARIVANPNNAKNFRPESGNASVPEA